MWIVVVTISLWSTDRVRRYEQSLTANEVKSGKPASHDLDSWACTLAIISHLTPTRDLNSLPGAPVSRCILLFRQVLSDWLAASTLKRCHQRVVAESRVPEARDPEMLGTPHSLSMGVLVLTFVREAFSCQRPSASPRSRMKRALRYMIRRLSDSRRCG